MYSTYPNIVSKIRKTLAKLGLELLTDSPERFIEKKLRFYWAYLRTKEGEKVFFKSLLKREVGIRNRFLNEINFLKTLKENPTHPLCHYAPKLLQFSKNSSFLYLCYKFLPGKTKRRENTYPKGELKRIVNLLKLINSSPIDKFKFVPQKPLFTFSFYKQRVNLLLKNLVIPKGLETKIKKFINQNQKVFQQVRPCLEHGDFSEANVLFYKNQIKILDWEHVHLRNPLYDLVSFWVKRKREPAEQKELLQNYLKKKRINKEMFAKLFKLAAIELCLGDLIFFNEMLKKTKEEEREGKKDKKAIEKAIKSRHREINETIQLLNEKINRDGYI